MKYIYICKILPNEFGKNNSCGFLGVNGLCTVNILDRFGQMIKCNQRKYKITEVKK